MKRSGTLGMSALSNNLSSEGNGPGMSLAFLDEVVTTSRLRERPSRAPDHETENRALVALARTMADSPQGIFQKLVDAALELTGAGSAGISVFEMEGGEGGSQPGQGPFHGGPQSRTPHSADPGAIDRGCHGGGRVAVRHGSRRCADDPPQHRDRDAADR